MQKNDADGAEETAEESRFAGPERLERRSQARGLLILAVVALLASIVHAGLGRVFVHGWWNQW